MSVSLPLGCTTICPAHLFKDTGRLHGEKGGGSESNGSTPHSATLQLSLGWEEAQAGGATELTGDSEAALPMLGLGLLICTMGMKKAPIAGMI